MKTQLSSAEYDQVLACIEAIYRCRALEDFPRHVLRELRRLIPCTLSGYNEVNLVRNRALIVMEPPVPPEYKPWLEGFEKNMAQHPVVNYFNATGDGQALKISDFISAKEFRQLDIYHTTYRHMKVEDQMAIGVRIEEGFMIGIAFNRSERSFTEKDRLRLNLVRPHLIQAYVHAQERAGHMEQLSDLQRALGESGRGLISLNDRGGVLHATPGSFECLARYLPVSNKGPSKLPPRLAKWARAASDLEEPMILHRDSTRLIVRRVRQAERLLLLLSEGLDVMDTKELTRFKLTPRETEVLHWLAEGKSNSEIAAVLGLTSGTVKLHVERVLAKLGVHNRTEAALFAFKLSSR